MNIIRDGDAAMQLDDVRDAIALIKYKPGSTIELAPVQGRISDPDAGALRIIVRLTLVDAETGCVAIKTHSSEIPPADHIRDLQDLMRHIRNVIRIAENYENDQWIQVGGRHPFRGRGKGEDWTPMKLAGHN